MFLAVDQSGIYFQNSKQALLLCNQIQKFWKFEFRALL